MLFTDYQWYLNFYISCALCSLLTIIMNPKEWNNKVGTKPVQPQKTMLSSLGKNFILEVTKLVPQDNLQQTEISCLFLISRFHNQHMRQICNVVFSHQSIAYSKLVCSKTLNNIWITSTEIAVLCNFCQTRKKFSDRNKKNLVVDVLRCHA